MEIYLLTAFFVVYSLVVVLCSQIGFPRTAKAGFFLIGIGSFVGAGAIWFALDTGTGMRTASSIEGHRCGDGHGENRRCGNPGWVLRPSLLDSRCHSSAAS